MSTMLSQAGKARKCWTFLAILLTGAIPAYGQWYEGQRYEITPLVGGLYGGSLKVEQPGLPNLHVDLEHSLVFGVAGGIRFDGDDCDNCSLIEFRWLRQFTHLSLEEEDPLIPSPRTTVLFQPEVTIDRFLVDFTREFPIKEAAAIRPFITATLGAALLSAPASSNTRFVFGFGTGLKVFPKRHWGFRVQVEYLPMVLHTELQRLVCFGGCIVALNGGITSQFDVTVGPAFRF